MTHRGPFQPQTFCDSVILWYPRNTVLNSLVYSWGIISIKQLWWLVRTGTYDCFCSARAPIPNISVQMVMERACTKFFSYNYAFEVIKKYVDRQQQIFIVCILEHLIWYILSIIFTLKRNFQSLNLGVVDSIWSSKYFSSEQCVYRPLGSKSTSKVLPAKPAIQVHW